MIIMGLWDRSRYGWFLHNGRPVTGSPETIRGNSFMTSPIGIATWRAVR